jgi:hypothetical protein
MKYINILLCSAFLLTSCTFIGKRNDKNKDAIVLNSEKLQEESKALTDAALRSSGRLPPGLATDLVRSFLEEDQRIEGLPLKPFDVDGLFNSNKVAWAEMKARYTAIREMEVERAELNKKLQESQAKLEEMGKKYEEEKNKSIVKRVWAWTFSTLGIGGIIALCIFFPAIIPIFGSILSGIISVMPKLVNFFGVVGKSAFDSVVAGVQNTRDKLKKEAELPKEIQPKYTPQEILQYLDNELYKSTDKKHREIIKAVKRKI